MGRFSPYAAKKPAGQQSPPLNPTGARSSAQESAGLSLPTGPGPRPTGPTMTPEEEMKLKLSQQNPYRDIATIKNPGSPPFNPGGSPPFNPQTPGTSIPYPTVPGVPAPTAPEMSADPIRTAPGTKPPWAGGPGPRPTGPSSPPFNPGGSPPTGPPRPTRPDGRPKGLSGPGSGTYVPQQQPQGPRFYGAQHPDMGGMQSVNGGGAQAPGANVKYGQGGAMFGGPSTQPRFNDAPFHDGSRLPGGGMQSVNGGGLQAPGALGDLQGTRISYNPDNPGRSDNSNPFGQGGALFGRDPQQIMAYLQQLQSMQGGQGQAQGLQQIYGR